MFYNINYMKEKILKNKIVDEESQYEKEMQIKADENLAKIKNLEDKTKKDEQGKIDTETENKELEEMIEEEDEEEIIAPYKKRERVKTVLDRKEKVVRKKIIQPDEDFSDELNNYQKEREGEKEKKADELAGRVVDKIIENSKIKTEKEKKIHEELKEHRKKVLARYEEVKKRQEEIAPLVGDSKNKNLAEEYDELIKESLSLEKEIHQTKEIGEHTISLPDEPTKKENKIIKKKETKNKEVVPEKNIEKKDVKVVKENKEIKEKEKSVEENKKEADEKRIMGLELEMKLEDAREKYVREYDKCKKEADKERLIDKTRNAVFNILAGVKNLFSKKKIEYKKEVKVEDYFKKETIEAKKAYDKARVEKGNFMYDTRRAELEKAGLKGKDLENALINYKATEILSQTIIEERQKIIDMKAEKMPIKIALWKRLVDGYMKIEPRWKKVALSTLLFLPLSAAGAVGAGAIASYGVVGLAGLAGVKFTASMLIGAGVGHLAKGIDWAKKGADLKFKEKQDQERSRLTDEFSTGKLSVEEYEKGIGLIENEEKKRARNRTLLKFGVGGALALAAGYGSYTAMGYGVEHLGGAHAIDATSGADMNHSHITSGPRPPLTSAGHNPETGFKIKYPFPIKEGLPHPNIEVSVLPGKGAISTLRELQNSLKVEYGNDLNHAPASVRHILETDPHKLAQEYGMYEPGQDAESALIKPGASFRVDGHGNVNYHEVGVKNDLVLEKGIDTKGLHSYEGKMIDTDHPVTKESFAPPEQVDPVTGEPINGVVEPDNINIDDNQFKAPVQVNPDTAPQVIPEEKPISFKHFDFKNEDHILSIDGKGGSLKMQFLYDENGKIIDVDVAGRTSNIGPNPYILEGELEKLEKFNRLDADVDILKMTSEARFLDLLPKDTLEYKFLSGEVANMQKGIIDNYGNVLNPDRIVEASSINVPLEEVTRPNILSPEMEIATKEIYINNIKHLFPNEKSIGLWDTIKNDVSVEKIMELSKENGLAEEFKPLLSYIEKLTKVSGLTPTLETPITNAESIPHFMIRAEETIAKMGRLDEIKL